MIFHFQGNMTHESPPRVVWGPLLSLSHLCCPNVLALFSLMFHSFYKGLRLTYLFLSRGTHWLSHAKAALTCLSNSGLVPVVGTSAKMRMLVPEISFSNCAETKLTNSCLVQEEGEKGSPKEPRTVKRHMCCLGLGEEGKKWSNEKILEATDT